jgi:opacity protein-like surface antigen
MRYLRLVVACSGVLSAMTPLQAQRPISIGLAGGVSLPQGERNLLDRVNTGWHALGTFGLSTLTQPLGVRVDLAYNRFPFRDGDGHQNVTSGTVNGTYRLPMTNSPISPYLIAGVGAYSIAAARPGCELAYGCDQTVRVGWNLGLGAKLFVLGFRSFVESRYHTTKIVTTRVNYFPVTFGLMF